MFHKIAQEGEQGDLSMPMLFGLGLHPVLRAAPRQDARIFAHLDDVYVICRPEWSMRPSSKECGLVAPVDVRVTKSNFLASECQPRSH